MRGMVFRLLLILLSLSISSEAHAWGWYFEFGGGLAQVKNPKPLLPEAASNLSSSTFQIPVTLAFALQSRATAPLFHLGVSQRYFQGTATTTGGGTGTFKTLTTYPVLRLELGRIVLGAGYSPWVWRDITYKKNPASALLLEASFLFPITPEIDFGLNGAVQSFKTDAGSGPKTLEYGVFFRLNYGLSESSKQTRRKFKGWRYPFGVWKN